MSQNEKAPSKTKRHLVQATAEKMREMIFAQAPDTQIGSLPEVAAQLGVGIVTVQQAARILEHEGLLEVRRGPGGGYYGMRPDEAALKRLMAAYLQVHEPDRYEAIDIMTLLDCELMPAAALCTDETLRAELRALGERIDSSNTPEQRIAFENRMHDILFRMVNRPLMALLGRVSMSYYAEHPFPGLFRGEEGVVAWKSWRHHIVNAILSNDEELARFEATRHRADLLRRLRAETPNS